MDFIVRIFGIAPDGGSGSLEFLLFALPLAGLCFLAYLRRKRNRDKAGGDEPRTLDGLHEEARRVKR